MHAGLHQDYRPAAAALLVHAAAIEGNERDKLHTVIKQRFRIAPFEFRAHSAS
jgi:hypothetical protein